MQYLTEYNPTWPLRFTQITSYLASFIPDICVFHHIGSTSVPDMPAKDIIDLDIEYPVGLLETIVNNLGHAGYRHLGEMGIAGRYAFEPLPATKAASLPSHHLYACQTGEYELQKHLAYREYLKANPDRAQWLASKKIQADASAKNRDEYIENKSCYYARITQESLEWLEQYNQ